MSVDTRQTYPSWVPSRVEFPATGSVAHAMVDSCRRYGDRTAVICGEEEISYAQLDLYSERLGAYLRAECGLVKGDRVAVMMPNIPAYPIVVMAILRAGLVVVNVNPLYTARELKHQLVDSGAKSIVIAAPFEAVVNEVLAETSVEAVLLAPMGEAVKPTAATDDGLRIAMNSALAFAGAAPLLSDINPQDRAFLQYTGGTTGPSKGATLSHGNILANQEQLLSWIAPALEQLPVGHNHLVVTALPLYHVFALTVNFLAMMTVGATNVLIANPRDLPALVEVFKHYPVSVFTGVNTLFNGLLHTPGFRELDFSSLQFVAGGGAPIQAAVAKLWKESTGSVILEGYGLSETSPLVTINSIAIREHNGSVGFAMPSTDIVLLDADDQKVADGVPGELCVRGPQVMSGYWNRPDANAEAFTAEGFFRTGDVAVRHANGTYQIVDRKKDMILVSGFNVYPAEIEGVCAAHPKVFEAACVGVPDARTGEAIKVFVVPKEDSLNAEELQAHFRQNLTAYKVPRHVEFVSALPKSPVGKILRRELRTATAA